MATTNLSAYDKSKVPSAKKMKFAIVVAEWNSEVTEGLYEGAYKTLIDCKCPKSNIVRYNVPGSFELIYAANLLTKKKKFDAVIVLGSVIQGETRHFDFVCTGVTNGIASLNATGNIPVIFGLLTDNNMAQAKARSGGKLGNKGVECAVTAIRMVDLKAGIKGDSKVGDTSPMIYK